MRALEMSHAPIAKVRRRCPFIGYDQIRRNERSPVLSMSATLRCWVGSASDTPRSSVGSADSIAVSLTTDDADALCGFLDCAIVGWGRDAAYARLWSSLN